MRSRTIIQVAVVSLFIGGRAQSQVLSIESKTAVEPSTVTINTNAASVSQSDSTKRRESSISGRVLDESGQPIPNAAIYIRKVGAQSNVNRNLGTDQDGKFRADDLPPGAYSVSAYSPGSVAAESDVWTYYRPGDSITLRMIKGAVITGTVTNLEGEPIVAARVSAIRVRDGEGRAIRGAGPSGGNLRQTDDRGVYRLYGLQSGTYLIAVNGGFGSYYPASAYDGDAPTYHPSTTRDAAAEVTVHTGDEVSGIDIRYRGDRGHAVSGTLSGSLGSNSMMGVSVTLTRASSGAIESNTYASLRGGDRGFALHGVPDGEYDLTAQMGLGTESSAASAPRRVVVKGTDVTGLDISVAPLGVIGGRVALEGIPEADRKAECKGKQGALLDETVIAARRDEKGGAKEQSSSSVFSALYATPDGKGEFKVFGLIASRYRIETRLPTDDWFVRSIAITGPAAGSKAPNDVSVAGLALSSGQRVVDLTVTVAEGAAGLRGKVVAPSEGASLPARLRVHLVPAEGDAADAVLRYAEVSVDNDGAFSFGNIAPGKYFLVARALNDAEMTEREVRPAAWDAASRTKLRREAEANLAIDLQRCQRVSDYSLKYTPTAGAKKPAPRTRP